VWKWVAHANFLTRKRLVLPTDPAEAAQLATTFALD
jgi:hypothetical protein